MCKKSQHNVRLKISPRHLIPYTKERWSKYYKERNCYPQRNYYHCNGVLQKYESNGLLTRWWIWLLWHCCWSLARKYINTIYVYNLSRLCTININWSHKRKWCHIKKGQEADYSAETMTDADYTDDPALVANIPVPAKFWLHNLEQAARGIGLCMKANKTKFIYFKQERTIFTLSGKPLKSVDHFIYLGSNISSSENNANICIWKGLNCNWQVIDEMEIRSLW